MYGQNERRRARLLCVPVWSTCTAAAVEERRTGIRSAVDFVEGKHGDRQEENERERQEGEVEEEGEKKVEKKRDEGNLEEEKKKEEKNKEQSSEGVHSHPAWPQLLPARRTERSLGTRRGLDTSGSGCVCTYRNGVSVDVKKSTKQAGM